MPKFPAPTEATDRLIKRILALASRKGVEPKCPAPPTS
jgi:hypothetical protein